MILHDESDDLEIRDPDLRDAWETELQIRDLRDRNSNLHATQSGPQYILATFDLRLSTCATGDSEADLVKAWIDKYAGAMASVSVLNDTFTCSIEASELQYASRGDWLLVTLPLRLYL